MERDCQKPKEQKKLDVRTNDGCYQGEKPKSRRTKNSERKFTKNLRNMLEETRRSITIMSTKASKMETNAVKGSPPKDLWTDQPQIDRLK